MSDEQVAVASDTTASGGVVTPVDGPAPVVIPHTVANNPKMSSAEKQAFGAALALFSQPAEVPAESVGESAEKPATSAANGAEKPAKQPAEAQPAEDPFKTKFEILSRKEAEYQREKAAYKAEIEALRTKAAKYDEAKRNPARVHEALEMTQEEFIKQATEYNPDDPAVREALEAKAEARKALAELQAQKEAAHAERQQALLDNYRKEAQNFVNSSEEHEYVKALGADGVQAVMNRINKHYAETQETLSYKAAADQVEQEIEEKVLAKFLSTKKVQSKFAAPEKAKQTAKGLTGDMTARSNQSKPLTEKERMAQALKLFRM